MTSIPDHLADLPPSAKLLYHVLDHEGPLAMTDLVSETQCSMSTVQYGLQELRDADAVTEHLSGDARGMRYDIAE